MTTTPNLGISHIAASQNQKEVTANAAFDDLDTALTDYAAIAVVATDVTPAATIVLEMFLEITGAQTADLNLVLPATKRFYMIRNSVSGGNGKTVSVTTNPGFSVPVLLQAGDMVLVYCDGTDFSLVSVCEKKKQAASATILLQGLHGSRLVVVDATSGAFAATLPDVTLCDGAEWEFFVKDASGNLCTVTAHSGQNINGASTYTGLTAQYKYLRIKSDGVEWRITGSN